MKLRDTVIQKLPITLLVGCPIFAMLLTWTMTEAQGSIMTAIQKLMENPEAYMPAIFYLPLFGSVAAWSMIALFVALQVVFLKFLPGSEYFGPTTPAGERPRYKDHGLLAFLLTMGLFFFGNFLGFYKLSIVYDHFLEIIGALNVISLLFCLFLYIKGKSFPNCKDRGSSGSLIFDYYWGMELYPRLFGIDVKQLTNCRFGMMSWGVLVVSFAAKQIELYGFLSNSMMISIVLQIVYVGKFFYWEKGYMSSMDIMHDRAGFYICWGCLVWVPSVYASPALYLVHHPIVLSPLAAFSIFTLGALCIVINYHADLQRLLFRLQGDSLKIWGAPARIIPATYTLEDGTVCKSSLLASGYWGLSRHFHYLPEWLASLAWTLPALFDNCLPYFYVAFLAVLLGHRIFRNEARCEKKYGAAWQLYCKLVPNLLWPRFSGFRATSGVVKEGE